jgi:glycosyltransferase involved in cell wall biosynthesis
VKDESGCRLPLVSIVTPVFNSGNVIAATMESVFSQRYPRLEYIVIDGGSKDNTGEIIKQHADKIAFWLSEPDGGISDAFNKGIRAGRGEIIGIINAGDKYTPDAVATAVKTLIENPDFDFVYGDIVFTDRNGTPQFLMNAEDSYEEEIRYTMPSVPHPTVFMRREVYNSCGLFDTSYRIAMDYEFLLRITLSGKKGRNTGRTLAWMSLGGLSDTGFLRSYKEVCRASIRYGYSPVKAYARFYLKGLRGMIRILLERAGLVHAVTLLRKMFWNIRSVGPA